MPTDLTKKAVEMLLKGASLLAEPCPYCKGVRVLKDGNAFCVSCGKEPEEKEIDNSQENEYDKKSNDSNYLEILENKLNSLSKELELEKNHEKQQEILKSINSLVDIINKLKTKQ